MPNTEVTLILSDWTRGSNGKKLELPHIPMDAVISDIKKSVLEALDASDLQPETILLFVGTLQLRDDKLLRDYNKSGRSKLSIDVYERVDMNLKVKTLQHCGSGGCVCIPVWSFLCRQTIKITIGDHETVGDLRTKIAEELDDPNRYKPENIKLTFMSNMLFDDSQTLRDAGIHNDDTINLLVDCCYWKKSRKTCNEGAASAGLPHGEAVEEAGQGAAEAEGAVEQAAAEHNGSAAAEATQDAPLVEDAAETKE
ncbi:ubiquitin, putative [Eimeria acervulina]|uniref:Ubiquitin, putative n=1 Tax=Eimeria acervulina TaxID=5801 RepID=U6GDD0_EIMAC|nr:ubiquitin, putative [Eimeria acervulina]CDI77358.1 ubiquitin, putative [Eimeria acervulina]